MARLATGARVARVAAAVTSLVCTFALADGTLCPNGAYVNRGPCTLCPDGSYVAAGTLCIVTPVGGYSASATRGSSGALNVSARGASPHTILCPDGSYVMGRRCVLTPEGRYTGG